MTINFSDQAFVKSKKSIFLAGPTVRNSSFDKSWRKDACKFLASLGFDGVVYVPEFSRGDNPFDFINQAVWERQGLQNAGAIVFNLDRQFPENPGLTTNVEFGMWLARRPWSVILCSPEGAVKNRYLEWLYNTEMEAIGAERPIHKELKDALAAAMNHAACV